jgi:hypothetical protein
VVEQFNAVNLETLIDINFAANQKIKYLCNMKIIVEAPRKRNDIAQCTRCQCCGHAKTYCASPYILLNVEASTTQCKKYPNTPA